MICFEVSRAYIWPAWRCFQYLVLLPMSCTLKQQCLRWVNIVMLLSLLFHIDRTFIFWLDTLSYLMVSSVALTVCRCQTWSDATTGRRPLSGPLWTPGSWRNAAKRYTDHLGETKLLVRHHTINSHTIWYLWDNFAPSNVKIQAGESKLFHKIRLSASL